MIVEAKGRNPILRHNLCYPIHSSDSSALGFSGLISSISTLNIEVTMTASTLLKSRVRRPSYLNKLVKSTDELIHLFPNGAYVGWSGFTGVGYPKYVAA